ncbi:site-specific integrase [Zooshikella ganghwensis]|uniref:Tyr recombinase domain-containing protein n=1 Tax=Zooshikella ganghwensis TaxID=202772 RepID=A0A4P9VHY5_9GAMM|nr:site-specific integrase [Zooshikella ganghwensis]RDH41984.1 hypothetical protein B9G39_00165 [Zooshikella ganghwensis]
MSYLQLRGATYYFRKVIPIEMRGLFCKREIQISLRTKSKSEAKYLTSILLGAINTAWRDIKTVSEKDLRVNKANELESFVHSFVKMDHTSNKVCSFSDFVSAMSSDRSFESQCPSRRNTKDKSLSELYELFQSQKLATEWGEKTKEDYYTAFKAFIDIVGDVVPTKVDSTLANKYSLELLSYPQRRTLGRNAKLSLKELSLRGVPTISVRTAKNHFMRMNVFLNWLTTHKYIKANPLNGLAPKGKKTMTKKQAFNKEDLKLIFSQPTFKMKKFNCEWQYWLPVLALYTGARLEELAQLDTKDIKEKDGIYYLDIHNEESNQLKTESSVRMIPLHSKLIQLGFLDYVSVREGNKLFNLNKVTGKYGKNVTKWFTKFKQRLDFPPTKVFHSFRHTFRDLSVEAGMPSEHLKALLGHTQKDITHRVYGTGFGLELLNKSIQRISFDIEFI